MAKARHPQAAPETTRRVALIPWGFAIEDFLEPNGLTLETFCSRFRGSWMFGYVEALRTAGVETLIVCFSRAVLQPSRRIHEPTAAGVLALPLPRVYRAIRRAMRDPYGRTARQAFGAYRGLAGWPLLAPATALAPYLATPVRTLRPALRREGVEAVICQEYEFPRFDVCALSKRFHRLPLYGVFQGGDYRRWQLERLVRPVAVRACDGLIVGASAELERVERLYAPPAGKVALIPNPVNVNLWQPSDGRQARATLGLPQHARIAVWHGRVQLPKKGLDVLLDAWAALCRERRAEDLRLVLVGDGEHASTLAEAIARSGLGNIMFINRLLHEPLELRTYLAAANVYVFPSRHEGVAVAPAEAMACGLPVVATDAGGVTDVVGEGPTAAGIVVRRDDADALAEALGCLLGDEALSRSLGDRARQRAVELFSLEVVGTKLRTFVLETPPATKIGR